MYAVSLYFILITIHTVIIIYNLLYIYSALYYTFKEPFLNFYFFIYVQFPQPFLLTLEENVLNLIL